MRLPRFAAVRTAWSTVWTNPRFRFQVLAGIAAVLFAILLFRGLRQGGALGGERTNDFAAYHAAARAVLQGDLVPAYSAPRPYQYPPALAAFIAPLGLLPPRAAAAVWTAGSLILLALAFRWMACALGPPVAGTDVFLGFFLAFRMAESDFANGNANTLILFLMVLGFRLVQDGKDGIGGGILGIATAVKVTPILLLPWILARRRWPMAGGFLLGAILSGFLFPGLVLGPAPFVRALEAFHGSILRPLDATRESYGDEPPGKYIPGQSLRALIHRLLRESDATAHDGEVVTVNVASLPKGAADAVYLLAAGGILLLLLFRFRGTERRWTALEIGAALAAMVLLSPLSRKAHFLILFPAAAAGWAVLKTASGWKRWAAASLWGAAFALSALTAPALLGRTISTLLLGFCPLSLAAGLLIALCALGHRNPLNAACTLRGYAS